MSSPTAYEQLTMELVNRIRMDPGNEYARLVGVDANIDNALTYFGVDLNALQTQFNGLTAVAPLAWNTLLNDSATTHSERMIRLDEQAHNFEGEPDTRGKFDAAGYPANSYIAENIFAFSTDARYGHAGFVIDWGYDATDYTNGTLNSDWQTTGDGIQDPAGHRNVIMSATYTEIGVGVVEDTDPNTVVGPYVTTQHFGGRLDYVAQFLGVVINDTDGDSFYDIGEGMGGVTVTLTGNAGTFTTTSWDAGGWQIEVPADTYEIVFSGGGLSGTVTKTATLGTENVKIDAMAQEAVMNLLPAVTIADQTIRITDYAWIRLSAVMGVTDGDGDAITQYELRDTTGSNSWYADGALQDASTGYITSNLAGVWMKRDDAASTQTLEVRAHDGTGWGNWESFVLTTDTQNTAPVVTVADQAIRDNAYRWLKLSDVLNVSDADGDTIKKYQLWDSTGGNNWFADNKVVDAKAGYVTSNLTGIWMQRDDVASDQTLWVRAHDGASWGAWDSFKLTTVGNSAPVVSVDTQKMLLDGPQWVQLSSVWSVTDGNGDPIKKVRLFDTEGGSNWWADGGLVDASAGYETTNIKGVWIQRDTVASTSSLGVQASDGYDYGAIDTFDLITRTNSTPTSTVADQSIALSDNRWLRLNSVLNVTDGDGDAITKYEVYDDVGGNNWWADGGVVDATAGYVTSNLAGIWMQRDDVASDQTLWVRAHDGFAWGAWESFNLSSYEIA